MSVVEKRLDDLKLPDLMTFKDGTPVKTVDDWKKRREEIIGILCEREYGNRLPVPGNTEITNIRIEREILAGKADEYDFDAQFDTPKGKASFPVELIVPRIEYELNPAGKLPPIIVFLSFGHERDFNYYPREYIIDSGFACAHIDYAKVASDNNDFTNGIAPFYADSMSERLPHSSGKLMLWAFAASRTADCLESVVRGKVPDMPPNLFEIEHLAVAGHSRLGKTALIAAMLDERFKFVLSNDSGCSGAAITRSKRGETPSFINQTFPGWFCPEYNEISPDPTSADFDQHFLLSTIAPRNLCIHSASLDIWADPDAEYLNCVEVDKVWKLYGKTGFVHPDRMPQPEDSFSDGDIAYYQRKGKHFFSNHDWIKLIEYIRSKI